MEKEEIQKLVADSISAAMGPITESIGKIADSMVNLAEQQTTFQQKMEGGNDPEKDLSPSVKNWIEDKRTGGLGGKSLEGDSRFSRSPQNSNNNHLSGKEI